jgi:hypothetical protein
MGMAKEMQEPAGPQMVEPPITINIGNIADGAVIEAFDVELAKVLTNIMDLSTEARTKRRITLELEFHPKDDRIQIGVQFTCASKLAGLMPSISRMFVGKTEAGELVPLADDPRQMNIFAAPKPVQIPAPIIFSGKK